MLVIDITFFLLELGVGLIVGSLALMADAFHMVSTQMIIRPLAKLTISS
jgi:Co/Zn/Cd efflux system component